MRGHGSIIIYWKLRFYRELHANDYYLPIVIRFIVPIDLELISYIAREMYPAEPPSDYPIMIM